MRSTLRRLGVSTVTIAAVVAAVAVPAHADPATGTITGRFTDAHGAPLSAGIGVYDAGLNFVTFAGVDGAGNFTVPDLTPGGYKLNFFLNDGTFSQWAYQKVGPGEADTVAVTAGATAVVNETLIPTGSLAGTIGGGFAGIEVSAEPLDLVSNSGRSTTDDTGRFEIPRIMPGQYRLTFRIGNGATQYYPHSLDPNEPQPVAVVVGQRTEITDTLLPVGSASGRLVEDGVPVEGAHVGWTGPAGWPSMFATTDADGRYRLPHAFAGSYRINYLLPDSRTQWARGKLTEEAADLVTVAAGTETVVDEAVLPTGQARIRAVDAKTGAPILAFCANIRQISACTEDGVATFAKVPAGRHPVEVFPQTDAFLSGGGTIDVPVGGVAELAVPLTPAAVITTVVRDRRSGAPVADVCVDAITPRLASFPDGSAHCSDERGRVQIGRLAAGTYTLFATPQDGVHGVQWVGRDGGTGNQFAAKMIAVEAGQTVAAPPVRLDRAGSISGRITDKTTGAPIQDAGVTLLTNHPGVGATGPQAFTDATGRYTLTGLGPYDWPLHMGAFGHASQWSGAAPSRLLAIPIKVREDRTASANAALTKGTTIRGTGVPEPFAFVIAYDAVTGDVLASTAGPGNEYELRILGPMAIRIRVDTGRTSGWHRNAADFAHATVVLVPSSGTKTVNLQIS